MNTCIPTSRTKTPHTHVSMPIQTTLYDLIAAVGEAAGPGADDAVTATVVHMLNTYQVICQGDFADYQLVCDTDEMSCRGDSQDELLSVSF